MVLAVSPDPDLSSAPPSGLTRCLVVGRLDDLPPAWIERVRAGRGTVEAVGHPLIAFAEALRHEVADRLRPSFGLARQESIAVIFGDVSFRDDLEGFAAAIRAHAPEVSVWTIEDGTPRRLAGERAAADPGKPPSLRLAGTEPAPTRVEPPPQAVAPVAAEELRPPLDASVTAEEIEMLLRFFDSDPDPGPDGRKESSR